MFIIDTDFESILLIEDDRKQNPKESYTSKNILLIVMAIY